MTYSYKAAIVDDESYGRNFVSLLMLKEFPGIEIVFTASGVDDAADKLRQTNTDILLLDIELGDGNAFDLLNRLGTIPSQIIFITAYDRYAIQAIKNNAIDFVLKPIDVEEFTEAVNKAVCNIDKQNSRMNVMLDFRITLSTRNGFRGVLVSEIIRCEADSNYTWVYLADKSKTIVSKTLHEFELQLRGQNFFRIHHKHLINLAYFSEYIKQENQVILSEGSVITVSSRKKKKFIETIKKIRKL